MGHGGRRGTQLVLGSMENAMGMEHGLGMKVTVRFTV